MRLANLCGALDRHLRRIEEAFAVKVSRRNEYFRVEGPRAAAEGAMALLERLYERATQPIDDEALQLAL
ncbi:MAG: PhoH family protein, partial [Rubrivivax sp.]